MCVAQNCNQKFIQKKKDFEWKKYVIELVWIHYYFLGWKLYVIYKGN